MRAITATFVALDGPEEADILDSLSMLAESDGYALICTGARELTTDERKIAVEILSDAGPDA